MNKLTRIAAAISIATACSAANSAAYTFDLENYDSATGVSGNYAQSIGYNSGSLQMSLEGFTSDINGSNITRSEVGVFPTYGLGIERSDTVEHTIDNVNGYDFMAFSFSEAVILDAVTSGWHSNDSDISVLALTGTFNQANWDGSWTGLTDNGFTHIGDYLNLIDDQSTAVNSSDINSQYWLIGAYNSGFDTNTSYSANNDYLKLSGLTVSSVPAPDAGGSEAVAASGPGSLGLIAAGFAGLMMARSRVRDQ